MDALKFFKEWNRMCSSSNECAKCPFNGKKCDLIRGIMEEHIVTVERWSQEHPRKTRQDVFLEHYPDAALDNGILQVCPRIIYKSAELNCNAICYLCKEAFWMQEVE